MAFCRRHRECCLGGKSCITNCVCLTILCPNYVITIKNLEYLSFMSPAYYTCYPDTSIPKVNLKCYNYTLVFVDLV